MTQYLTTRELADLLRIKERKVYDLAASGQVPCSKSMGKLLFPRDAIEAWIAAGQTGPTAGGIAEPPPNVFLGSHDPLLEWALRESRSGLAIYFDGSMDGLRRFTAREGIATGLHIHDARKDDWNTPGVLGGAADMPVVLVEWAKRRRGIITGPKNKKKVSDLESLRGLRIVGRQADAGAQILLVELMKQTSLGSDDLEFTLTARSETDAALAVLEGKVDAGFGLEHLAQQYGLRFSPIIEERFDLLVDRRACFEPPMQAFFQFCRSAGFLARAADYAGYDVSTLGTVHFNGR